MTRLPYSIDRDNGDNGDNEGTLRHLGYFVTNTLFDNGLHTAPSRARLSNNDTATVLAETVTVPPLAPLSLSMEKRGGFAGPRHRGTTAT